MLNHKYEDARKLCSLILKQRRYQKWLSTYYKRIYSNLYSDSCFRCYYYHVATSTSRLTSDLQQIPRKEKGFVKRMFVTRYK